MEAMECNLLTNCQMMDFNYQAMEEELTCPVCLELYADPLMLPCSHSMCKKCLEVIVDCKASKCENFECPSCRAVLSLDREKMLLLPKNLALENIVVRFTEERSRSINQCRLSTCFERDDDVKAASPAANNEVLAQHDVARRPVSLLSAIETVTLSGTVDCGLCDASGPPCRAIWFCQQCKVSYCSGCLKKFHPQRGALAKHHLQPAALCEPPNRDTVETAFCTDHITEQASMFCDRCKLYVCHLCVCDGEGRHAGHKMLSPDAACAMIKNLANKTKEQSDSLLATLLDEQTKLDAHSTEMKALCVVSCAHVEQQYQRFIDDLTTALIAEKQLILNSLDEARQRICRQTDSHNRDNERCSRLLSELSSACQRVGEESTAVGILSHAAELQPLVIHMKRHRREVGLLRKRCESILKDKSSKLQLLSGTEQFRKRIVKLLSWFVDDGISGSDSIIPHIITSSSAVGKSELVPRVPNKYLTTWGFSSTTFTGESVSRPCSWTVTVERNTGHWGGPLATAGYLFGIGVSSAALGSKDVVGMTSSSHALVCVGGGALCFAHDGHQDVVAPPLDGLPVTVTIAIRQEAPDVTVFTYKLASVAEGRRISLVGRKILHDAAIYANAFPVFTVSQRVKILFPTYV